MAEAFTVNDKGSIGVAKVVADLLQQNFYVFLPFDGSSPVDLVVANKAMELRRLQIKYRITEGGRLRIPLSSVVNGKRKPIDLSKIDGWAVYCPDTDAVYYVPKRIVGTGGWFSISSGVLFGELVSRYRASTIWSDG